MCTPFEYYPKEHQLTRGRTADDALTNSMISALLASSRQYMKCEERDDAAEICRQDAITLDGTARQSMFCPPTHPKLRCQASLFTKKQLFNHDKHLPALEGEDQLAAYNIDREKMFQNSIDRYYALGEDSYSSRALYVDGKVKDPQSIAFLAVSVSKVRTINPGPHHTDFPFSNGDWTSHLTPAFLQHIRVNVTNEWDMRRQPLHKVGHLICVDCHTKNITD